MIYRENEVVDLENSIGPEGWRRSDGGWICPEHETAAQIRIQYEIAMTEFEIAIQEFRNATVEKNELPSADGYQHLENAFRRQQRAYSDLQIARRRLTDYLDRHRHSWTDAG